MTEYCSIDNTKCDGKCRELHRTDDEGKSCSEVFEMKKYKKRERRGKRSGRDKKREMD